MLHNLEDVNEASVNATDGTIGKVWDFLFDDRSWTIRYLVVDVRTWTMRHDVVIPVESITNVDWPAKTFHLNLSRAQVRTSPELDARRPVSMQQELAVRKFYGLPSFWHDAGIFSPRGPQDLPPASGDDPHLRSTENVAGYAVWELNHELGQVESFIMDDASWHIGFLAVKTGDWLYQRSMLIPSRWVETISWSHSRLTLRHKFRAHSEARAS